MEVHISCQHLQFCHTKFHATYPPYNLYFHEWFTTFNWQQASWTSTSNTNQLPSTSTNLTFRWLQIQECWCNMAYINISIAIYTRNPKAKYNVSWLTPYKILKNRLYCLLSWLLLIAPPLTVAGRHSVPHELGGLPVILINFLDDHMCTKRLIIATTPSILSCFRKSTTGAIMQIIYLTHIIYNTLAIVCSSLAAQATKYNLFKTQ